MRVAGLLLAAGRSHRFGAADKLLQPYRGRPLVVHAAEALRSAGLAPLVAVTASPRVAALLPDFDLAGPEAQKAAQSASLRAGILRAQALGAARVLVALGDMPDVPPALVRDVVARCTDDGPAAATDGVRPMPPACFPASFFPALLGMDGDRGAAHLLADLPPDRRVAALPAVLRDIDTPADLAGAQAEVDGVSRD